MTTQTLKPLPGSKPRELEFPHYIDSSMRGAFAACPQKFLYEYMMHYKPISPSVHLLAGGAFAKGLEVARQEYYGNGNNSDNSIGRGALALIREYGDYEPDARSPKTAEGMLGAYDYYFSQWPLESDTLRPYDKGARLGVEFSFAIPIPQTKHPQTGDPILYVGRFDMLGELPDGTLWVVDEKTTQSLGASWSKQWDLRGQFTGYCWAAREYGFPVKGAIIRGISILKRSYGHAQAITYRSDWLIDSWLNQLQRDVHRLVRCWDDGEWDRNYDGSCTSYGNCAYTTLCESHDPQRWIAGNYAKRVWNPLTHEEESGGPTGETAAVQDAGNA